MTRFTDRRAPSGEARARQNAANFFRTGGTHVAACLVNAAVPAPPTGRADVPAEPFWQLHGAAPAAREAVGIAELRRAAHKPDTIVVALRVR